mmetsp:Transcript_11080/g.12187  ORF Transcript_11080/g.12187 Transcript_11080/m.12187 type:complete len:224 (+) Transcript_11080:26-697(+)
MEAGVEELVQVLRNGCEHDEAIRKLDELNSMETGVVLKTFLQLRRNFDLPLQVSKACLVHFKNALIKWHELDQSVKDDIKKTVLDHYRLSPYNFLRSKSEPLEAVARAVFSSGSWPEFFDVVLAELYKSCDEGACSYEQESGMSLLDTIVDLYQTLALQYAGRIMRVSRYILSHGSDERARYSALVMINKKCFRPYLKKEAKQRRYIRNSCYVLSREKRRRRA